MNADVIQNINKGFSYFTEWLDSLLSEGTHMSALNVCTYLPSSLYIKIPSFPILQTHKSCSCHSKVSTFIHKMCLFLISTAWDLLRINVYGFIAFCKWFFRTYPTYFISPIRLSGSAVESLFSQYKYSAGGKLDLVNYTTARAACLVRQSVATHCSGKGYRDENLHTTEITLKRKVYTSITDTKNLTDTQAT